MTSTFQVAVISLAMLVSYLLTQRGFHYSCPQCGARRQDRHREDCSFR